MCGRSTLSASGEAAVLTGNARLYCDERARSSHACYESSTNLLHRFGIPICTTWVRTELSVDCIFFTLWLCNEPVCEAIQFVMTRLGLWTNNGKLFVPSLADNVYVDRPHMESHCSSDPRTAGYFTGLKQIAYLQPEAIASSGVITYGCSHLCLRRVQSPTRASQLGSLVEAYHTL